MSKISLVVAVDENWGIGINNGLLCHLPADLQYFKKITMGKPIIMGYKTYLSIGKALPGRTNIVLSTTASHIAQVQVATSLSQALSYVAEAEEVMIIGGERVFTEALDIANTLYVSHIHHKFEADVHFPAINKDQWFCKATNFRMHDEVNTFDITFAVYERVV